MTGSSEAPLIRGVAVVALVALAIAGLYFAREVLIPTTLAIFLTFLLTPAVRAVERLRIGRIASVVIVASASLSVIGAVGWLVASQAAALVSELPEYHENIRGKVRELGDQLARFQRASNAANSLPAEVSEGVPIEPTPRPANGSVGPAEPPADAAQPVKVEVVASRESPLALIARLAGPVMDPLVTLSVTAVFLFFFLTFREDLRDRLVRACGQARIPVTTATVTDTASRVARYFAALALANAAIGTVIGAGLYAIGVPKALLWGLLAAILRFIPYVGATLAALFPAALSAAIFETWWPALLVIGWTVAVDVLAANFLEPWLFGSRVGASPTGIVFSFVFWSWLWGGIGFLLAIPITVCLIVVGRHVPAFEPFYILLGNEPVLEPKLRLYQRLLAADRAEAVELLKHAAEETDPLGVVDTLILPTLAQLEHDRSTGLIDQKQIEAARDVVHEMLESTMPVAREGDDEIVAPPPAERPLVLVPDRGAFDDLLPEMVRRFARKPVGWRVIPAGMLAAEATDYIHRSDASSVVFLAIEPPNVDRIVHIHRRLTLAGSQGDVYVGLFVVCDRGKFLRRKLQRLPHFTVASSFAELLAAATGFVMPSRPPAEKITPSQLQPARA